jgi:hypothetical protein
LCRTFLWRERHCHLRGQDTLFTSTFVPSGYFITYFNIPAKLFPLNAPGDMHKSFHMPVNFII